MATTTTALGGKLTAAATTVTVMDGVEITVELLLTMKPEEGAVWTVELTDYEIESAIDNREAVWTAIDLVEELAEALDVGDGWELPDGPTGDAIAEKVDRALTELKGA